jgi:signal peptidase II
LSAASLQQLGWAGFALGSLLCIDQASKALLLRRLAPGDGVRIGGGARLRCVVNARWVSGVRPNAKRLLLLWTLTCAAAALLLTLSDSTGSSAYVGMGIAVGGATGNLLDLLLRGGVVDFVDLRFWPVFNIADAAILGGVVLALSALFF